MMSSRRADTRAAFVLPFLRDGLRVLDVGCGPGTITSGLADAVAPHGIVVGVDVRRDRFARGPSFALGSVYALPVATGAVDVAFAHGLCEHLGNLPAALEELRRALRPNGVLALASSDWSGAVLTPHTEDVDLALRGHYRLRRAAGGDPFAGGRLADAVRAAGFTDVTAQDTNWPDMSYVDLADYVAARQAAAGDRAAHDAARRWARQDGVFTQRWVQVTARR